MSTQKLFHKLMFLVFYLIFDTIKGHFKDVKKKVVIKKKIQKFHVFFRLS